MFILFRNIGITVFVLLLHLYFYSNEHIKKFDYEFYDFITLLASKVTSHEEAFYTVVVDIDEKSLHELGQWPWPRVIDAQLIDTIHAMNPSAIGINILFPEKDRVSPLYIQNFYKSFFDLQVKFREFPEELKDNDKLLSTAITDSESTLAIYLRNSTYTAPHCQNLSYKEGKSIFSTMKTKFQTTSLLCNHKIIQDGSENFGFINAWRDSDGILRRVPLFMRYQEKIFPSFALATLFSFDKYTKIETKEDTLLINFSKNKPKKFSAIDILSGKIPSSEIQNKIVIVGSSVVGLSSKYITATGSMVSNNMIHAFVIDNILSRTFLKQPNIYKLVNISLSFLFTLLFILLLSKKLYIPLVTLFVIIVLVSFLWLINSFINGIYISIGYLLIPLFYALMAMLLYHLRVINKEREQQEKFLIRQSKMASMGEVIALIAHQWRQPLSAINGIVLNIDMDYRRKNLPMERLDEHLNKIEETTAYLSRTINDFTDFFSKNKQKDEFEIIEVINQSIKLTAISSQKNIDLIYNEKKSIHLTGYKSELIQSILIVLNNAIYATLKNLSYTTRGKIIIRTYHSGKNLFISIEDNGGGINPKHLKIIFDPYFTTKDKAHGTGLGLYILKLIVEDSMNGKLFVSNGKEGAIFIIRVPLHL